MAHYAFLDSNNVVITVITGKDEEGMDWEEYYCEFAKSSKLFPEVIESAKRTSYNTKGGIHYDPETGLPSEDQSKSFRKNYAGIGYSYDSERDAFIPPKPYDSWILNEETCIWEAPVSYPNDNKYYEWNEEIKDWVLVELQ